ncbi:MAG TPA: polysaccharide deacetylase family protein [Nitrospiria bacterium]|nr:polysaccharide deacetylase family protein [Nitrospiria bacterium]
MAGPLLVIKVDVDTDRGTRLGVPALLNLFKEFAIHTTFYFSLGPDNTGRAVRRLFRLGFFGKVVRTNVVGVYGVRTLLNGVLWPGPHIGHRNEAVMRAARDAGHEVGIHCYDHIRWQDGLAAMSREEVYAEFNRARKEFERIFDKPAITAGAAGWQANRHSLAAYDDAGLSYASDARGDRPFFPRSDGRVFKTLQIPTTLPTLDEVLGRPDYPPGSPPDYADGRLIDWYCGRLDPVRPNVLTIHAELEGMRHAPLFRALLRRLLAVPVTCVTLGQLAERLLRKTEALPVLELGMGRIDGRSGTVAVPLTPGA